MRVDGREIPVSGSLLQPRIRRTSDILRVVLSALLVALVVIGSLITRSRWEALERSLSDILGVLPPDKSNLVYVLYSIAICALPFAILLRLLLRRQFKLLVGYVAAGQIAIVLLSLTGTGGLSWPQWHWTGPKQLDTFLAQFLDDPRWIAMLAAVLTVASPWLPASWRRGWWALLLAFVPLHLFVSLVVPSRAIFGLAGGWFIGAVIVLVVGTPALEVPLEAAVRVLAERGYTVTAFTVLRPAGPGPLQLAAETGPRQRLIVEMYGQNQRSYGMLRQVRRYLTFRAGERSPAFASLRRAVEHRALLGIAIGDLGLASSKPLTVAALGRAWTLYAHTVPQGRTLAAEGAGDTTLPGDQGMLTMVWRALQELHRAQISHGDLRAEEIRITDGRVLFGGFSLAEFGAYPVRFHSDVAQLLLSTAALFGAEPAVRTARRVFGDEVVLLASRRLTKSALPRHLRRSVRDAGEVMKTVRAQVQEQTGEDRIEAAQITRYSRNQIIQLVLLFALVYVAYPFISQVPTFFTELGSANWWWALVGLTISALTYVGAAMALWGCAGESVNFRNLLLMQVANTFAATTTPAGVGGLALSVRFLQRGGLGAVRATAAVALQQTVQVVTHVVLLIVFSVAAGVSANLSHFVPSATVLYFAAGALLGVLGVAILVPTVRRWLRTEVRPQLTEVVHELRALATQPQRLAMIVGGCATTTLGAAGALWAGIEAFGGHTTFVTVTVVTMIGGTLASAAPTPGGVGAVEAALIGGLAAFGVPAAIGVPSVLLYRVLTCWLPVFCGWPIMRWLTDRKMI
ncbi:lysylphosphatidylglycerol synthase transmembrane domain-containing protein [Nocardia sp. alder85J]|uniref:lysylphosphatidylglycerol synthase transmembrane domain-containing protein n=1 Tax=Nocardia sp. alder85J TaxID=2862949 RepID=UPI001CD1A6FD|nr:lysylphosphatidylglycerol synthase transmembrane domain-containing protein [Nocardia sp. alder85J]MCX4096420.1 lysylphosphatidylglycerol synthase domain-containing protein [Nocardia sp. alder85J]